MPSPKERLVLPPPIVPPTTPPTTPPITPPATPPSTPSGWSFGSASLGFSCGTSLGWMILSLGRTFFGSVFLVDDAGGGGGGGGGGATFSTTATSLSSLGGGRVENQRAKPRSPTWSRTETTAPDPKRDLGVTPLPSTESNIRLLSPVAAL